MNNNGYGNSNCDGDCKTTVVKSGFHSCDICAALGVQTIPLYDSLMKNGMWAALCENHYKELGIGELGLGKG